MCYMYIFQDAFFTESFMLIKQNVNSDVSNDCHIIVLFFSFVVLNIYSYFFKANMPNSAELPRVIDTTVLKFIPISVGFFTSVQLVTNKQYRLSVLILSTVHKILL